MFYIRCVLIAALGFVAGFSLSIPVRLENLRLARQLEEIERQSVALQADILEKSERGISRYRDRLSESKKQAEDYFARLEAIGGDSPQCPPPVDGVLEPIGAEVLVRVDGESGPISKGESGVNDDNDDEDTIYFVLGDALHSLRERQSNRN